MPSPEPPAPTPPPEDEIYVVDDAAQDTGGTAARAAAKSVSDARARALENPDGKVMLEARNVHKYFGEKQVLVGLSLVVHQRETLCIVGGSGCGKSTLLRVLCGLTEPEPRADSSVLINGQDVFKADRHELDRIRGRLGMVFQYAALLASYSVFENVALPLLEKGEVTRAEIKDRVADVLEKVHLPGTEELMPAELSGGMRKRVGIARAIIMQPDVILFDEPTSGLDPIMTATFDALVLELRDTLQLTSVIVTHDLQSVYRIADRVIMLHQGKKMIDDSTEAFRQSDDPVVRQFVRGEVAGPVTVD